jgi:methionyl-tRNA synthetase
MYVRCDALSNYITGQWYGRDEDKFAQIRPANLHIIWKDILRFHAAFRPAMLMSANISLPKKLLVHGHVTQNWKKMWKSTWNVIDPFDILKNYDPDALKFTFLYDSYIWPDADFSVERLNQVLESMLIWSRWNLINRVTKLSQKYGINKASAHDPVLKLFENKDLQNNKLFQLFTDWFDSEKISTNYIDKANLKDYVQDRYQIVQHTNEFIQTQEPRKKYKNEDTKQEALEILEFLLRIVKNLAILSSRFLTNGFTKIQNILGNPALSKIDTSKTIQENALQISFNQKEFSINLNPEIIYQRIE